MTIESRMAPIALIGGGKMGEAIISGLVNGALFAPESLIVADPGEQRRDWLQKAYGVTCVADGASIKHPTTCILAVKPQVLREVAAGLAASKAFTPERVISIAAGVTTATLRELFCECAIIRVMPNTPLMVGAGMCAVSCAEGTLPSEGDLVCELFSLMGDAVMLDESLMDVATAVNGSGPALFARFALGLVSAAHDCGLDQQTASRLVLQTMAGTSRLLELGDLGPEELIAMVKSPGGTTQAALESFDANGLDKTVGAAVAAAVKRAEELA
jgi:pyrroline-5-carboxylate reductase